MIGRVFFVIGEENFIATLQKDGKWYCPNGFVAGSLNIFFDPRADEHNSPANGGYGRKPVEDAAQYLKGRSEYVERQGDPSPLLVF